MNTKNVKVTINKDNTIKIEYDFEVPSKVVLKNGNTETKVEMFHMVIPRVSIFPYSATIFDNMPKNQFISLEILPNIIFNEKDEKTEELFYYQTKINNLEEEKACSLNQN